MKNFLFALILSCCLFTVTQAQQGFRQIKGIVVDSSGESIADASVSIIRMQNRAGLQFARTNDRGIFSFSVSEKYNFDSLAIQINCIGYEKKVQHPISLTRENRITLASSTKMLPDVTVKTSELIILKGDTLKYNADAFASKNDRYLGDVLAKLPGITVDANGQISYQGKPINMFTLGGDDLLGANYNIATDNIPNDIIDKIEVIEHNQRIKMLNGIIPSDQAGINITFKNKNKFRFVDNAEIAGGTSDKWDVSVHNMSFQDKFKAINEIKSNNVGNDYSRETGITDLSGSPDLDKNLSLFNKVVMANINDLYKLSQYAGLRVNGYYLHDLQSTQNQSSVTYFLPDNNSVKYEEQDKNLSPINAIKVQLGYNLNSPKAYVDEVLAFNQTNKTNEENIVSNGQSILQNTTNKSTSISNSLQGYILIHKKHIINYNSVFQYSRNPQQLFITPGALPDYLNDSISYLATTQLQRGTSYFTNNNISYNRIFGKWTVGSNLGFNYQNQQFSSGVKLLQNDSVYTGLSNFSNALHWQKWQIYFTPQITFNGYKGQLNITLPVNFANIQYKNDSVLNNFDKLNHIFFAPVLSGQYFVGKENNLHASYSYSQQAANINQVFEGSVLSDYRNYASYQMPLLTCYSQQYGIGFAFKKTLLALFANIDFSYNRNKNYFIDSMNIQSNANTLVALPIGNTNSSFSVSGNAGKYIYALNTTVAVSASFTRSNFPQMQNGTLFSTYNNVAAYSFKITPTILKWLDLNVSAGYTQCTSSSNTANYQNQLSGQWRETSSMIVYPFKNFSINFTNQYFKSFQRGVNVLESALLLNSYLQYKFTKPKLLLRLTCSNLANVQNYNVISISNNIVSSYGYLLQPRMALLSAQFSW